MSTSSVAEHAVRLTSDDRELTRRLFRTLQAKEVPGLQDVYLHVDRGAVTVLGSIPSWHARRLLVECCRHVAGVRHLRDELLIRAD